MSIEEKLPLAAQPCKIYGFKEGLFYKFYNQNAMWFVNHVKPYKVQSKFIKAVKQTVYSVGCPLGTVQKLLDKHPKLTLQKQTHNCISYITNTPSLSINEYNIWCTLQTRSSTMTSCTQTNIIKALQNFDIVNQTPMQAVVFLAKLKQQL